MAFKSRAMQPSILSARALQCQTKQQHEEECSIQFTGRCQRTLMYLTATPAPRQLALYTQLHAGEGWTSAQKSCWVSRRERQRRDASHTLHPAPTHP